MAEVEKLIVELDAKFDKYIRETEKADKKTEELGKSSKNTGALIVNAGKAATAAIVTLGAAISTLIITSANSRQELEALSRQAKLNVEDFQALAFATKQFGVNGEQIADISKDIADRLGEFATAGTGTFQDFADVMELTKTEAQALAMEWQNLSSDQVIGRMVAMMEEAGASGNQMTFVLESMGNDLSKLLPLFTENSQKLTQLKKDYDDVAGSLQITQGQAQELKKAAENFDLLTESLAKSGTVISATLAPIFNDFFQDIIKVVPTATQAIVDFINSFLDAENITSIAGINKQIEESEERILGFREKLNNERQRGRPVIQADLNDELERLNALKEQLEVLEAQKQSIEDAKTFEADEITGEGGGGRTVGAGGAEEKVQNETVRLEEARKERLKELDNEYAESRIELLLANEELQTEFIERELEEYQSLLDQKLITEGQYLDSTLKLRMKLANASEKLDKNLYVSTVRNLASLAGEDEKYAKTAFKIKKALRLKEAIMGTAKGVAEALPNYPLAIATGIAGAAQVAAIASTSFDGGGGSSSGPVSSAPSDTEQASSEPIEETSTLDLTARTEDESRQIRIVIGTDDGSNLIDTIGRQLREADEEGRV